MDDTQEASIRRQSDHDLLVRVDERVGNLIQEFKDLKDNTKEEVISLRKDHDFLTDRVGTLENWRWYIVGGFSLALLAIELYTKFR